LCRSARQSGLVSPRRAPGCKCVTLAAGEPAAGLHGRAPSLVARSPGFIRWTRRTATASGSRGSLRRGSPSNARPPVALRCSRCAGPARASWALGRVGRLLRSQMEPPGTMPAASSAYDSRSGASREAILPRRPRSLPPASAGRQPFMIDGVQPIVRPCGAREEACRRKLSWPPALHLDLPRLLLGSLGVNEASRPS
jgi:hypothetical protein